MESRHVHDLLSRFIVNLPYKTELRYWNRLWYHLELAYYFWIDFYNAGKTPELSVQEFGKTLCEPLLKTRCPSLEELNETYSHFVTQYKYRIPVCRMALERKDNAILFVKNKSSGKWGLPGGKINKDESKWECAQRELHEETGLFYGDLDTKTSIVEEHQINPKDPLCEAKINPKDPLCEAKINPKDPLCEAEINPKDPLCEVAKDDFANTHNESSQSRGAKLRGWGSKTKPSAATTIYYVQWKHGNIKTQALRPRCSQEIIDCRWMQPHDREISCHGTSLTRTFCKYLIRRSKCRTNALCSSSS